MKDYKVDKESFSEILSRSVRSRIPDTCGKSIYLWRYCFAVGAPQRSWMVGRALKEVPDELSIPCHGVINSNRKAGCPVGWNKNNSCWQKKFLQS